MFRDRFVAALIWLDVLLLCRLLRPVWAVSRWTGWDSFKLARIMVMASPVMLMVWWSTRYGMLDAITPLATFLWVLVCWMKLRDFDREEPALRRNWAHGEIHVPIPSALTRVITLDMFLILDLSRIIVSAGVGGWARVVLLLTSFHCTVYALALFVHVVPPGPPPRRREKRDWLAWLRPKPVAVAT